MHACVFNDIGLTTDGEFNILRWHGHTRHLTIVQLRTDSRAQYKNKSYITASRSIKAVRENPALPEQGLLEIYRNMRERWKSMSLPD